MVERLIRVPDYEVTDPSYEHQRVPPNGVVTDYGVRCAGTYLGQPCRKLIAEIVTRPWQLTCGRCHTTNRSPA